MRSSGNAGWDDHRLERRRGAMYGYTAEEIVGRNVSVLIPPGREEEIAALFDRVRGGQRVESVETQRVRKDGVVIDVSVSMSPIRGADGTVTGVAGIASDITGRVRADRAAQDTRSRLAAIVESSSDAILGKTLDGVITSWNGGAVAMYGYAAQEMIGHHVSELAPPDRVRELAPILERVRRGSG